MISTGDTVISLWSWWCYWDSWVQTWCVRTSEFVLQPMAREYQNGDGFGYILAFRKKDTSSWTEVRVPRVESSRHVYYNSSLAAYTPFEVKIKAYNRKGEGPFSQVAVVHSAEEGEYRWRSANSTTVWSLWQMSSPVSVRTATLNGCSDRITALYRSSLWWMFVHTKMSTVVHCECWTDSVTLSSPVQRSV